MHCISAYPFDDHKANLKMINILREKFNCKVGYSGHEKGGQAISFAAVSLGASSIERHFTLDRTMYGSDQSASLEPEGFKNLVNGIRKISNALKGDKVKKILPEEVEVAKKLRSNLKL
jgi:N-acetylneuraminate synthase